MKDVIISGGENVSSIEIESRLYKHPRRGAGRRGRQARSKMGRGALRLRGVESGGDGDEADLIAFCRESLGAASRRPRRVVFGELPKTSTGKIQKFLLREQAKGCSRRFAIVTVGEGRPSPVCWRRAGLVDPRLAGMTNRSTSLPGAPDLRRQPRDRAPSNPIPGKPGDDA